MDIVDNKIKAEVLTQALPYIKKYHNKTVVVKYGGNAMINEELKQAVMSDIVLLSLVGVKVVLVHGGGPELTDMLKRIGKESKFVNGLRYTDKETAIVAQMVLGGKVNKELVAHICKIGGRALGLTGIDDKMFDVEKVKSDVDLGYVGDVKAVNTDVIETMLENRFIPVVATVGMNDDGTVFNINADTAAAAIAAALKAENIILLTDIPGLLRDVNDPSTLIPVITVDQIPALMKEGVIKGGMIPKIECCVNAIKGGVKKAVIIDGRTPHSIIIEVLSDSGVGTMIRGSL